MRNLKEIKNLYEKGLWMGSNFFALKISVDSNSQFI